MKGNFILVQGSGPISEAIALAERSGFTHAGILTEKGTIIEAMPQGIQENPLEYERYAIFEFINATDEQCAGIIEYARSCIGEKYGYAQDIGFAINGLLEEMGFARIPGLLAEKRHIVCSAFVDLAARSQGIIVRQDRQPGDVTPAGLSFSPEVRFVYGHNLWEL
jgi:hypothetical protein